MRFSLKETATAALPNSSSKSRSVWKGIILAAAVIVLVPKTPVSANDHTSSGCRLFKDHTFYCWDGMPPPSDRTNEEYHDCAYERGGLSVQCMAWFATHPWLRHDEGDDEL